ncbi:MAG: S8 family serine peptidase [Bdellovibrionaceae bacterium]|nr:S8 family serine peptidase [Pseudobdellovibrionaceae bacterium]
MRPWHVIFGLSGFFILFFAGLATWFTFDGQWSSDEFSPARSQSSTYRPGKDNRTLEKSEITAKMNEVPDEPSALFNDPAINQAWGLKKADAARAWSVSKGSRDINVCVIDTGIDIRHEDIAQNLWRNPGESGLDSKGRDKCSNGIDDDGNGHIDDCYGWNFVSNNNNLTDNHGHGTHIAGIIGAEAGNGKGISGISPQVSLMILKYYDPKVPNTDNLKNTIASIRYCVKMGAHIINYSGGGTEYSQDEHDAVAEAERKGILFVAAAGNERSNSDQHHYYPADYKLKNIISVTAIDPSTQVLSSSNYGIETVDIAAPGQNILSTLPGNSYGFMTGTSQATAFVTGAAALIMAHKQSFKAEDVKKYVLSTGDAMTSLASKTRTSRQLNLYKSLTILDSGVGASGVVAIPKQEQFTVDGISDPAMAGGNARGAAAENRANSGFAQFGRSLINAIEKGDKKLKPSKLGGGAEPVGN